MVLHLHPPEVDGIPSVAWCDAFAGYSTGKSIVSIRSYFMGCFSLCLIQGCGQDSWKSEINFLHVNPFPFLVY